ncbi:hypothetical protein [Chitinophaga qingshengii]|uniref:DUF3997 domain-containing protein n=1 Tax=Chitinophaga qingshengii TaxID=1569794 RepID=A0ABR7TRM6_9BACT|nr:hypothetical protein [Chitinophaga qingshengii]MBC9932643.1 hypothetical protein [Chitinophaga qingshengii]
MKRYATIVLCIACLSTACLDPFLWDEKRVIGNIYLAKNENAYVFLAMKHDGSNYLPLTDDHVLEVVVVDSVVYIKQIGRGNFIDTSYCSISLRNWEKTAYGEDVYEAMKRTAIAGKGIAVTGW